MTLQQNQRQRADLLCPERVIFADKSTLSQKPVLLTEHANDGRAEIEVVLDDAQGVLWIDVSHRTTFQIIRVQKNCDGAVAIYDLRTNGWTASVVEIKHKVTLKTLLHAREQLEAGAVRLAMVLDFLGIQANEWSAVLVYAVDAFSAQTNADPVRLHRPVGGPKTAADRSPIPVPNLSRELKFRIEQIPLAADGALRGSLRFP